MVEIEESFVSQEFKNSDPFYRKHLKTGEEDKLVFTVRLNEGERQMLDEIMQALDIPSDSTALKTVAFKGWQQLQNTFGSDFLRWLADKDRVRNSDRRFKR